jgi:predicted nuclease of predicted toxin-antitoxin system
MKLLADENCEREMVDGLRMAGHDVITILDMMPSIDDATVFRLAQGEGRVLLTNDHDFGLIAERAEARPPVVILMRLDPLSLSRRIECVVQAVAELGDDLDRQFIVVEPHRVRTRTYDP